MTILSDNDITAAWIAAGGHGTLTRPPTHAQVLAFGRALELELVERRAQHELALRGRGWLGRLVGFYWQHRAYGSSRRHALRHALKLART